MSHPHLKPGDPCPDCRRGKLRRQKEPATTVTLKAQPPVAALIHEMERLRCDTCGTVFTAPIPAEAAQEKFDPTVGVMVGFLRYGSGVPFHRLERLQRSVGSAEGDNEVVGFLNLPKCYRIPTPIGHFYEPDFGLVLKRRNLKSGDAREYYFVIETKSTNNLEDRKALTDFERWKIKCALKHFDALGIEAKLDYAPHVAPVKDYQAATASVSSASTSIRHTTSVRTASTGTITRKGRNPIGSRLE